MWEISAIGVSSSVQVTSTLLQLFTSHFFRPGWKLQWSAGLNVFFHPFILRNQSRLYCPLWQRGPLRAGLGFDSGLEQWSGQYCFHLSVSPGRPWPLQLSHMALGCTPHFSDNFSSEGRGGGGDVPQSKSVWCVWQTQKTLLHSHHFVIIWSVKSGWENSFNGVDAHLLSFNNHLCEIYIYIY